MPDEKFPRGYYEEMGIIYGFPFGMFLAFLLGLLFGNMKLMIIFGPVLGTAIGVSVGALLEKKHNDRLRPLTARESKNRKILAWLGGTLLFMGLVVLILTAIK